MDAQSVLAKLEWAAEQRNCSVRRFPYNRISRLFDGYFIFKYTWKVLRIILICNIGTVHTYI